MRCPFAASEAGKWRTCGVASGPPEGPDIEHAAARCGGRGVLSTVIGHGGAHDRCGADGSHSSVDEVGRGLGVAPCDAARHRRDERDEDGGQTRDATLG